MKKELLSVVKEIVTAEREIELGKNIKSNEDKIEIYLRNLSPKDLVKVVLEVEKILDK